MESFVSCYAAAEMTLGIVFTLCATGEATLGTGGEKCPHQFMRKRSPRF